MRNLYAIRQLIICVFIAEWILSIPLMVRAAETMPLSAQNSINAIPIPVVLFPRRRAELSSEVSSPILRVYKELGETFKTGDTLLTLKPDIFLARKEKAQADCDAADAALQSAEKLYKDRSRSFVELMTARREATRAHASLQLAEYALAACTIQAPFDGRVARVHVNEHDLVQEGKTLISIVDDRILRARFLAPETCLGEIRIGQHVTVVLGEKQTAAATVTHVSNMIDAASGTFEVFAEIDNTKGQLVSGMTGILQVTPVTTPGAEQDE